MECETFAIYDADTETIFQGEGEFVARAIGREAGPGTQSVERALSLLSEFTEATPQRRVSELVEATGLGQSTVSRLVGALVALGFLAYDQRSGLYGIGPRVITLAGIGLNEMPVHQQSRQVAQNLAADLNLGANVAERRGAEMFYLCHFEGVRPGGRPRWSAAPGHCTRRRSARR